ncbi:MAG: SDR family oxidoreductase [Sterolibacterium sp.]|nr:SDR family oxidoreductase [Sterolibacterium sp.]
MAFKGKVALVTGGASGMGQLDALRLAKAGAKVAIIDLNDKGLQETAAQSPNIKPYRCDVSNLEEVQKVVAQIEQEVGPIDRLVHCAAIMPGQSVKDMPAEFHNKVMAINYFGTVNLTKTVMPLMEARGGGDIILYGSMAGAVLTHNLAAYSATKAAINAWAEILIRENLNSPIRFLLVCPPMVNTPLVNQATAHGPESLKDSAKTGKNMAQPQEIIDAVEAALERGDWVVRPKPAGFMMLWRRLFPGSLWWVMEKANKVK